MKIDRTGCTRIALIFRGCVIKLPNALGGWRLFLTGLLANMQENQFGKMGWPELCPVIWAVPGGWFLIMRRARVMTDAEFEAFDPVAFCSPGDYAVPVEHKSNSFGYLDGRVVAIDYGS